MIVKLICPHCRKEIVPEADGWRCNACGRLYPCRQGILSFLEADASFNPTDFKGEQEQHWSASARLRDRIRHSKLLSFLNGVRVRFSMSGRRDRVFFKEMRGGDQNRLILDIGCGGGRHYFRNYGKVVGIDPVLGLLQIAKTIYNEVYHASAFDLPFPDGTFDYVVSSDVIGHIPVETKDRLFAEMYRVLRPGGRTVHVVETDGTNCWFSFAHRYPQLFQKYFIDHPGHISMESASELQARFLKHGFKQIRFDRYAGTIQECGALAGSFDNELKQKSTAVRLAVGLDRILSRNFLIREGVNFLLEFLAQVVDYGKPIDHSNGALVVFEK